MLDGNFLIGKRLSFFDEESIKKSHSHIHFLKLKQLKEVFLSYTTADMNDIVENNLEFIHSFLSSLKFHQFDCVDYTIAGFLDNLHTSPLNKFRFGPGIF